MSELSDIDLQTLTKFQIANNLMSFTVFQNTKMDLLFEFISPIMKPDEQIKKDAYQAAAKSDLIYTEHKILAHPSGFAMVIYEGNRIRICLILRKGALNDPVASKLLIPIVSKFAEDVEDKHSKDLKKYEGNIAAFKDIGEIFKTKISLDLSLPHYAKYVGFDPESKIEEYVFGAADLLTRKIGYFYLPNLLFATKKYVVDKARDIILTDPKKAKKDGIDPDKIKFPSNEQFFIAMFKLRVMGMLIPIPINELGSYSKIKYPKMPTV
jgi:hypothetical protein